MYQVYQPRCSLSLLKRENHRAEFKKKEKEMRYPVHTPTYLLTYLLTYLFTYLLTYFLTYLLTPWCRVLLKKLTGLQLVKKFPVFHGARRFITALTSVRHLSLSWASPIQSIYPHPTSWRSSLILSNHLRLGLPSGLLPSGFPSKTLCTPLLTHTRHMPSPHQQKHC